MAEPRSSSRKHHAIQRGAKYDLHGTAALKSREEQLTWAKQRALICVDIGGFAEAVAGRRADLDENPLTKGLVSSDQAMRGLKRRWTRRSAGARKR